MGLEDRVRRIFGRRGRYYNLHPVVMLWFYRHPEAIVNLATLERILGVSHPTVRKIVRDLKEAGFLKEMAGDRAVVGVSRDAEITRAVFGFFHKIEELEGINQNANNQI